MTQLKDGFIRYNRIWFIVVFLFFVLGNTSVFSFNNDSLSLNIDQLFKLSDANFDVTFSEGEEYFKNEQYDKALNKFQHSLLLAEKSNFTEKIPRICFKIGSTYNRLSNFHLSLNYLERALKIKDVGIEEKQKGLILSLIASNNYSLGNYDLSYEKRLASIKIWENLGDYLGLCGDYYSLGSLFYYQKAYQQALKFYNQSYEIAKKINNPRMIYLCLGGLGATYEELNDLPKSIEFNEASLHLADSINYMGGRSYALHNLASNFKILEDYPKAIDYYEQSIEIKKELEDIWGEIGTLEAIGDLYAIQNQFEKAETKYKEALKLASKIHSNVRKSDIFYRLAELYKGAGKLNKAYQYLSNHLELKDSIMSENTLRKMGDQKTHFEIEKREHSIFLLKKDNELLGKEQEIQKLNKTRWIGLLVALLGLLGFFYMRYRAYKNMGAILKEKNGEIEEKNLKIITQNKELENSNEDLKNFAYVASHDLREPLRMIKSFGDLLNRKYKTQLDERGQEFLYYITDAATRMDKLLVDLLDYSRVNTNDKKPQQVSTENTWLSVQTTLMASFIEKNVDFKIDFKSMPIVLGYSSQLYQLFQNLISNAIKYQDQLRPIIEVTCTQKNQLYTFAIKDNGIGIRLDDQKKIFDMFSRLHTKEEFEGTGIGLATCKKIINRHGGDIWVESELGKGSTFYFTIPVPKLLEPNKLLKTKVEKTVLGVSSN